MKILNIVALLILTAIAALAPTANPALAHSFKVALVVPLSNTASFQGRQFLDGFMLATKERDSHPDQESDGHLGGLDVYVTVIDGMGDVADQFQRIVTQGEAYIVAAFGPEATLSLIGKLLDGKRVALLLPGQSPFPRTDLPAVAAFISAFEKEYSATPSSQAAQGYNAARRIDAAVRAQGGVDNTSELRRNFKNTARNFTW